MYFYKTIVVLKLTERLRGGCSLNLTGFAAEAGNKYQY